MIIDPSFLDHWKTRLLARRLNDPAAPCYVIAILSYCQTAGKSEIDVPRAAMAGLCGYRGESETIVNALIESKFLSEGEGGSLALIEDDSIFFLDEEGEVRNLSRNPRDKTRTGA